MSFPNPNGCKCSVKGCEKWSDIIYTVRGKSICFSCFEKHKDNLGSVV